MSVRGSVVLVLLLALLTVVQARRGWTQWMDRDNPSGTGDWEVFKPMPCGGMSWIIEARIKGNPTAILQARKKLTIGFWDERVQIGPRYGLVCQNNQQRDRRCQDYEVRFYCLR